MRIIGRFALRVMLAVHRYPLVARYARRHPQPEPEKMTDGRMKIERAMCEAAMKIERHVNDRNVRHDEHGEENLPPRKRKPTAGEECE
jgi:hypothetical protein